MDSLILEAILGDWSPHRPRLILSDSERLELIRLCCSVCKREIEKGYHVNGVAHCAACAVRLFD